MNRSCLSVVAVILLFVGTADAQAGQCTLSSRNVRASDACNAQTETYLGPKDAASFGGVCMSVTPSGCKLSATTTADKSCPKGWVMSARTHRRVSEVIASRSKERFIYRQGSDIG